MHKDSNMNKDLSYAVLILILTISSSRARLVQVCPGGNLTLLCQTNGTFLRWSISFPHHNHPEERIISSTASIDSQTPLSERSAYFQFLRTSRTPLISMILIDNINADLNETRIECMFGEPTTTVIIVIRNAFPTITKVKSEQFQSENVNVTLNWTQANNELYDIDVIPRAPTHYAESTTAELTLLYNVHYNINIVAFLCEFNRSNTIEFLYVQCPTPQQFLTNDHLVFNYNHHFTEGSNITLSCVHDNYSSVMFELVGPRIMSCTSNGQWKPDPREVECKVDCGPPVGMNSSSTSVTIEYNSTVIDSILSFTCKEGFLPSDVFTAVCLENGKWSPDPIKHICKPSGGVLNQTTVIVIAVISSLATLLLSCSIFCAIGCVCIRRRRHRPNLILDATAPFQLSQHNDPVYEEVLQLPKSISDYELKFNENVAYGPVIKESHYDDLRY